MRARPAALISFLFFLSGGAGLIYQVVWSRLLNEVFGITAHAVTAVLAAFLGGLALGSWAIGRAADRRPDPLRLYGQLELLIGATALAGTALLRAFEPVHDWLAMRLAPDSLLLLAARMLLASAVVLPPTFLMGGTLPVLSRCFVGSIGRLGRDLGLLYALNTAGAVLGSLAAGFFLIRALGVHATLWLAVGVNVAVGLASLRLARVLGPGSLVAPEPAAPRGEEPTGASPAGGRGLLLAMALSGIASLALEVLWTRELVLVMGTSTYAFATMLSTFLVGIALGSFLARAFLDRARSPRLVLGWIQLGIAATTLASIPVLAAFLASGQPWFEAQRLRWLPLAAGRFGLSAAVMIVPTTLIGMTFPVAAKLWASQAGSLGRRLGQVYGANTLGNIAGALVGGLVLLPVFGLQRSIALLALLNLAAAAWALWPPAGRRTRRAWLGRALPVAASLAGCAGMLISWEPLPFASGEESPEDTTLFYREGLVSTVKVLQRASDGDQLWMMVDGIRIGQSRAGVDRKQQLLAHLPFLLMPRRAPARVASVGLGTGILVGEVALHPGVELVECVELSPPVIEGARLFDAYNHGAMDDRRVHVINDDGINHLRRSPERYDAIIADGKSRSGHAGNGAFYSDDYFRAALAHLAFDGLMVQWVPLDIPEEDLRTIFRTFLGVFPYGYVWLGPDSSFLVGTRQPLVLDFAHVQRLLDGPEAEDLRRYGWRRAEDVASLLVADKPALAPWLAREATINSFEHPVIEFYALDAVAVPVAQRVAENVRALASLRREALETVRITGADPATLLANKRAVSRLLAGLSISPGGASEETRLGLVEEAVREAPENAAVGQWVATELFQSARGRDLAGRSEAAVGLYRAALRAWPGFAEALVNLGSDLALLGRPGEAAETLEAAVRANPALAPAHSMLGQLRRDAGQPLAAIEEFRTALRVAPRNALVHDQLGTVLYLVGRLDQAVEEFRQTLRLQPGVPQSMSHLALLLASRPAASGPERAEAVALAERAERLSGGRDSSILETLAVAYAAAGQPGRAAAVERRALALVEGTADPGTLREVRAALEQYERAAAGASP